MNVCGGKALSVRAWLGWLARAGTAGAVSWEKKMTK